jgi:6-phosphogluconate dehydrogenase
MKLAMIVLGRMGGNIALRLMRAGHQLVAYDRNADAIAALVNQGATGADSLQDLPGKLDTPAIYWVMLPAGGPTESTIEEIAALARSGDIIIDGGNSFYKDDIRRSKALAERGIRYVDVGTSGGVWGLERGYCMMIGGDVETVAYLDPIFDALAPGHGTIPRTPNRMEKEGEDPRAEKGYIHAGPAGAGHFVKMVHNGIEYGLMQAYAEGFEILHASDYELDLAAISELWMQGSVVRSWLLELAAHAFQVSGSDLEHIKGWVADSGEGRCTVQEAIDHDVPAPVITHSLQTRFRSRQQDSYGATVLAALRNEVGGHVVKTE